MRVKFPATNTAENRRRKRELKCFYHFDNYRNPAGDRHRQRARIVEMFSAPKGVSLFPAL